MATSEPIVHHGPDIFLSYRRTDKELVGKLVTVLEGLGPSVWWDAELEGGEDWRDSIVENLTAARCLVIVFSEACNSSKQLKKELAVADHLDKEVIPVLIEPTEPRGFFLYELAPLNWISIHPAPMEKLDSVARLLVQRLEAAGWTALPVGLSAEPVPPHLLARTDREGAGDSLSIRGEPATTSFAPPAPPETAAEARTTGVLPPPAPPHAGRAGAGADGARSSSLPPPLPPPVAPPSPTAARAGQAPQGLERPRLRDSFPFRWVDFILPTVVGVLALLLPEKDEPFRVTAGNALTWFVAILALTGLVAFPIRYYRRRSNPYRVARNLVISNVVFAVLAAIGGFFYAESTLEKGETVGQARIALALGFAILGLLLAAVSFLIFVLLSKLRARRTYQESIVRL